jgi:hypothetical protein
VLMSRHKFRDISQPKKFVDAQRTADPYKSNPISVIRLPRCLREGGLASSPQACNLRACYKYSYEAAFSAVLDRRVPIETAPNPIRCEISSFRYPCNI